MLNPSVTSILNIPATSADLLSGPLRYFFMSIQTSQSIVGSPAVVGYSFTLCMTLDKSYTKQRCSALFLIFNFFAAIKMHGEPQVLSFCVFSVLSQVSVCRFWRLIFIDWLIVFGWCWDTAAPKEAMDKVWSCLWKLMVFSSVLNKRVLSSLFLYGYCVLKTAEHSERKASLYFRLFQILLW